MLQNVFEMHFPINRISGSELDGGEGRMIQQRLEDCSLHSSRRRRRGGMWLCTDIFPASWRVQQLTQKKKKREPRMCTAITIAPCSASEYILIVIKTSDSYTAEWGGGAGEFRIESWTFGKNPKSFILVLYGKIFHRFSLFKNFRVTSPFVL